MINKKAKLLSGRKVWFIRKRLQFFLFSTLNGIFKNPVRTFKEVQGIRKLRNSVHGKSNIKKFVKSDGRYYWAMNFAGLPSKSLEKMISYEIYRNSDGLKRELIPQQTVFWAITNRCPLSCRHCFEWDNLDVKDHLSLNQLQTILAKIEDHGIKHVQLSGGEPLVRFDDLITLIKPVSQKIDFWLYTSGFGLTEEKAVSLKEAGLKGINLSLDHWDEKQHNRFRNNPKSFYWVTKAAEYCINNGLMVCLSLCSTKEFTSTKNLEKYLENAKSIGAHYVQILEPKAIGNFSYLNVTLSKSQIDLISDFMITVNTHKKYATFPVVLFYGYHQRQLGCMGAGNRYFYIDSLGEVQACPFCPGSVGNILEKPLTELIRTLQSRKCLSFKMYRRTETIL